MDKIASYRDLVVWQKAMCLVEECYRLTDNLPRTELFGLTAQLRRAAISIPSNIAEGQSRHHGKEYVHFLYLASGSLSEVETQMELARRLKYTGEEAARAFFQSSDEIGRMLTGLRKALVQHQKAEQRLAPIT
jgi:four helix bundle protein